VGLYILSKIRYTCFTLTAEPIRLQVYLSHAGIASRRACEQLIAAGRVAVNGNIVTEMGSKVAPGDRVTFDGKPVTPEKTYHYIALNKPPGYLCSSSDPEGRPLAVDLLPKSIHERLYNVGRLDFLSQGLILFTNDGGFAARLSHPSAEIEKEYLVEAAGPIPDAFLDAFREGIIIEDVPYICKSIERPSTRSGQRSGRREVNIVLIEGKNREIRRVFSAFHLHPKRLERLRIGPVELGNLAEGKSRPLSKSELQKFGA
jgi:23S rRNA pseudouridine2605 synthase